MAKDMDFESAFGELAYSDLKDKAPQLLDYLIGFQVLDKSDEDTSGMGVAAFQIGEQELDAPMFFTGGRLKGGTLLYLKDQDLFVPLKDSWISYLLNRKPQTLGTEIDHEALAEMPGMNLRDLAESPGMTHSASVRSWKCMAKSPSHPKYSNIRSFTQLLKKSSSALLSLTRTLRKNTDLANSLLQFYSPDELFPKCSADEDTRIVNRDNDRSPISPDDHVKMEKKTVKVLCGIDNLTHNLPSLSRGDKKRLLNGEIVIKDDRDPGKTSRVYAMTVGTSATSPRKLGLYDVLESTGAVSKMIVLPLDRQECIILTGEGDKVATATTQNIVAIREYPGEDLEKFYKKALPHSSLKVGESYVGFDMQGNVVGPFHIAFISTDTDGLTQYAIREKYVPRVAECGPTGYPVGYGEGISGFRECDSLVVTNRKRGDIRTSGSTKFLPSTIRFLALPFGKDQEPVYCDDAPRETRPSLGTLSEVLLGAIKEGSASPIKIWVDGPDFIVRDDQSTRRFMKRGAAEYLARDLGIHGPRVIDILEKASSLRQSISYVLVKQAYPGMSPSAPAFPAQNSGYDSLTGSQLAPSMDQSIAAPGATYADPNSGMMDQDQMSMLAEATGTGQKEVVDTAALGSLVKSLDAPALVDEFIGDMILGLDRIGRTLFLIYMHPEVFVERYGREDVLELEDSLSHVFESLGDVILVLKQKMVSVDPEESDKPDQNISAV